MIVRVLENTISILNMAQYMFSCLHSLIRLKNTDVGCRAPRAVIQFLHGILCLVELIILSKFSLSANYMTLVACFHFLMV